MNDHFLLELVWVLFTFGWKPLLIGLALALALVAWGSRRDRLIFQLAVLAVATLVLWIAIVVGTEVGYVTWQSLPNPPDEAFSDSGGPFVSLFLGWAPSLFFLGIVYAILSATRGRARTTPSSSSPPASPSESPT